MVKIGKKYKIRSWEDMEKEFGTAIGTFEIFIACKGDFLLSMKKYCGTIVTVTGTIWDGLFRIQEDGGAFIWSTDMITPLGDLYEAIQSRRHSSDSSMG